MKWQGRFANRIFSHRPRPLDSRLHGNDKTKCENDKTKCENDKTKCENDRIECGNDKRGAVSFPTRLGIQMRDCISVFPFYLKYTIRLVVVCPSFIVALMRYIPVALDLSGCQMNVRVGAYGIRPLSIGRTLFAPTIFE